MLSTRDFKKVEINVYFVKLQISGITRVYIFEHREIAKITMEKMDKPLSLNIVLSLKKSGS